ncbi:MAG: flavin reductase family protein [Parachlamydiales bacterium]
MRKSVPLSSVYQLLEPGPVVMVTASCDGKDNVMTLSWHMMIDFEPPVLGCVISNRNYTFDMIKKTKECVINIPTADLIKKVVGIGNISGKKINKFKKFDLLKESGEKVQVPLLSECYSSLECKVIDMTMALKYNIFILQVVKAWIRPRKKRALMIHHCGKGKFVIDGKIVKLLSKKK